MKNKTFKHLKKIRYQLPFTTNITQITGSMKLIKKLKIKKVWS